jgi:hypothetical protein
MGARFFVIPQNGHKYVRVMLLESNSDNGVFLVNSKFTDPSLPSEHQGKYLQPWRIREKAVSEVPSKQQKVAIFDGPIRKCKETQRNLVNSGNYSESVLLPLSDFRTLEIGPGLPLSNEAFESIFYVNPDHISTVNLKNTEESRDFETCRGSQDLKKLLKKEGLGFQINVVNVDLEN